MSERDRTVSEMLAAHRTLREIGEVLGISRERVRQIANRLGISERSRKQTVPSVVALTERLKLPDRPDRTYSKTGLTHSRLRELLHYDPATGVFVWRRPRIAGRVAGKRQAGGYVQIRVDCELYMAHVLAWFYSMEQWPKNQIDHINGIRDDNRLHNLRDARPAQNLANVRKQQNNTSGFKGVYKDGNRWRAEIAHIKLGSYSTPEAAAEAYKQAAKIRYGEFAAELDNWPNA